MKKLMLVLAAICIIASCKKKENENDIPAPVIPPVTYANYLPLKTGNYWIYDNFNLDTNGNYTSTGVIDSDYVAGDTLVNGITYYKWYRNNFIIGAATYIVRDSLHYIVDIGGVKLFSSQNFTDTFDLFYSTQPSGDTVYLKFTKMVDKGASIFVPAGTFVTSNAKTTYNLYPPFFTGVLTPRFLNLRYAENVGLIYVTLPPFASVPDDKVKKLIRYHLN